MEKSECFKKLYILIRNSINSFINDINMQKRKAMIESNKDSMIKNKLLNIN